MADAGYSKLKVLVVDDFDNFRMTVSRMLREFGVRDVDTAASGAQALQQCRGTRFDLILCDYSLGNGKNGQQVLEDLRRDGLLSKNALFVLVSTESSKNVVMAAYDCEPDDYLAKPVTTRALRQRLERLLARRARLAPIQNAMDGGDIDGAIALCRKEVEADSRYASTCQKLLGELYIEKGAYDEAEAVYRQVLEQRSLDWALVGMARLKQSRGDLLSAQQWLEDAIAANPMYMKAYDLQADILREEGSDERLQSVLEASARTSPLSIRRQQQLADTALANNDIATAAPAYKRAVRLAENSCFERSDDYLNLARTTAGLWREDREHAKALSRDALKALAQYEQRFSHGPEGKPRTLLVEAQLVAGRGDSNKGKQLLADAQTLREEQALTDLETDIELANAYRALEQGEKAQALLAELVANYQGDEVSLQKLDRLLEVPASSKNGKLVAEINKQGIACHAAEEYRAAIEHFTRALRKFPNHLGVRLNMLQAQIDQMNAGGVTERALTDAAKTLDYVAQNIHGQHEQMQRFRQLQELLKKCERENRDQK